MARAQRIQYENAFYHVMNRGRGRRCIFHGKSYYEAFVKTLEESHERFEARFHAYCLMENHYHLLVETPLANLDRIMRHINGVYTQRHNRFKRTDGPLFRGRYKAILIDEDAYLLQVSRYIHRNPLEIKGASKNALNTHRWSSYLAYINKSSVPNWLSRERTYRTLGSKNRYAGYRNFVDQGNDARTAEFYGGDCVTGIFGDRGFRQSIYEDQESFDVVEGLPELIREPVEMDRIVAVVAEVFGVDRVDVVAKQTGRRERNVARRIAIYCGQKYGRCTHSDVADYFSLSHAGSVASAIVTVGRQRDEGEFAKQFKQIERDLNIVKLP